MSPTETSLAETTFVESESATTNHEANHCGAAPVVISLVVVGVIALLLWALFAVIRPFARVALDRASDYDYGYIFDDDYGYGYHDDLDDLFDDYLEDFYVY